jgi:hypothetical protein
LRADAEFFGDAAVDTVHKTTWQMYVQKIQLLANRLERVLPDL